MIFKRGGPRNIRKTGLIVHGAPHIPSAPILEVTDLSLRYNGNFALDKITFKLSSGQHIAVVGPNGAGKSTLFKVIAGILPPSSGQVKIAGGGPASHICIAYLPQRSHVDWRFPVNVADVVMMGRVSRMGLLRWPRPRDWDLVHHALQVVGLNELADSQIGELSGGQQQRMFIARALAQEAELMLMDEPFTGLDAPSQEAIFSILESLKERRVTVLVAMHDLNLAAERFADAMLLNHRLIGFGNPERVFAPEQLRLAYGRHLHLVGVGDEWLALGDTCCDEGERT
jgi:ABC-type Mn2+/Zn2+ transport system ATPase subunit